MGLISPMVEAIKEQQQEIFYLKIAALLLGVGLSGLATAFFLRRRR
jgi:hypothetical protein